MKRKYLFTLIAFFLMTFFKGNLFLVDSSPLYIFTNIMGAFLFLIATWDYKSKFRFATIFYILLNIFVYSIGIFEISIIPAASGLFLFADSLIFLFPVLVLLFYLNGLDDSVPSKKIAQRLMHISLGISIVAIFVLLTGFFLSFSLLFIFIAVIIVQILEAITLLFLFTNLIKKRFKRNA